MIAFVLLLVCVSRRKGRKMGVKRKRGGEEGARKQWALVSSAASAVAPESELVKGLARSPPTGAATAATTGEDALEVSVVNDAGVVEEEDVGANHTGAPLVPTSNPPTITSDCI